MLLTFRFMNDIMSNIMSLFSFRRWIACTVMVAMFCNTVAPLRICWCEECNCERNISLFSPSVSVDEKCCGTTPETPSSCPCGDVQENNTIPAAVLPVKMPNMTPAWSVVSAFPIGFTDAPKALSCWGHLRSLLPLHVPLHVWLCVFLN